MTAEPITDAVRNQFAPGLYESMPGATYHAAAWSVSNSMRKVFSIDGPAHLRAMLDGAPEDDSGLTDDERTARVNGAALHCSLLEPRLFGDGKSHYVKPKTYIHPKDGEKPWNGNATVCKEWEASHADKPHLTTKEHARIVGTTKAILEHPVAVPLITARGVNEASIFARHPATGLMLRIRTDRLTEDAAERAWVIDLKSVPSVDKFVRSAQQFQYPVQQSFYELVMELHGIENPAFAFIACELKPRYGIHDVRVVSFDDETRARAREQVESDLLRIAECMESGEWPRPHQEHELVTARIW